MAKVRIPINPLQVGKVGAYSMYVRKGEQVVRQRKNSSNYGEEARRSMSQQRRRVLWPNLVAFYKANSFWMKGAFTTKKAGQTDYNVFMQANIETARIPFSKPMAEEGWCVADNFKISDGSLSKIGITKNQGNQWQLSLSLGSSAFPDTITVGELSQRIIANNIGWQDGDALVYIVMDNIEMIPDPLRVYPEYCEFVLDTTSTENIENTLMFSNPYLEIDSLKLVDSTTQTSEGVYGLVAIHTRNDRNLEVSTQKVVVTSDLLINQATTPAAWTAAVNSYGVDSNVMLSPGGE